GPGRGAQPDQPAAHPGGAVPAALRRRRRRRRSRPGHRGQRQVSGVVGTAALLRLALRRDRVLLPVWLGVFVLLAAGSASATAGANVLLGRLTAAGLVAAGLPGAGSLAFGLAWAGVGLAFAAIAAVTAQLAGSARAATGTAAAVLGAVYLLRAVGDTAHQGGP